MVNKQVYAFTRKPLNTNLSFFFSSIEDMKLINWTNILEIIASVSVNTAHGGLNFVLIPGL